MKKGYTFETDVDFNSSVLLISNYDYSNTVLVQSYYNENIARELSGQQSVVGMWKIKQLKQKWNGRKI